MQRFVNLFVFGVNPSDMRTKLLFSIALLIMIITGCKEDSQPQQGDYIIFGDYYGMCAGDGCVDYYKIENGILYKDLLNEYPSPNINHNFSLYNTPHLISIADIGDEIPAGIYDEAEVIGSPDAYDQGGYYIEIHENGVSNKWKIDKVQADIPYYLHFVCDSLDHYLDVLE